MSYPHTIPAALQRAIAYQQCIIKELDKAQPDLPAATKLAACALTCTMRALSAHNLINAMAARHNGMELTEASEGPCALPPIEDVFKAFGMETK